LIAAKQFIGVLTGIEDAEKLEAAVGKQGFFSKLFAVGYEMGDRDTAMSNNIVKLY
jgi:hypothetical protein